MELPEMYNVTYIWIITHAVQVAIALIVLAAGWFLSGFLSRQAAGLLPRTRRIDATIAPLLSQLIRYTVLVVTLVIVLSQFGVQTASILAVLGAAGLAIALALQGTLTNIASGVMLIWLRPFSAGDNIDAEGTTGTVVEIGLFGTQLRTADGVYVFAPNSKIWNARIVNYSRERNRRLDLKLTLASETDVGKARSALIEVAKAHGALPRPAAPRAEIIAISPDTTEMRLRLWLPSAEYNAVRDEIIESLRSDLGAQDIALRAVSFT